MAVAGGVHWSSRFAFIMASAASYTHLTLPTIYSVLISVVAVSLKKKTIPNTRHRLIAYQYHNI